MGSFYTSTPMMIAHRGTTKHFPENTIEAYNESIKLGYNGIELDVLSSKELLLPDDVTAPWLFKKLSY